MSLIKQLWIGICLTLILALSGSFFISTLTAREYLEQQLQLKNIDNANSLALSITQMDKDPVTLELLISAQFDSGHYQSIRLLDPEGNIIVERHYEAQSSDQTVPTWFASLLDIQVQPGIAQIQDGWQQFATLHVLSHSRYAQQELWNSSLKLLVWLMVAGIICGLIGTMALKIITRPLGRVVNQAESIGQRHFVTSSEPRTQEFRKLVRAMNKLSASVKAMLEKETEKLERLRTQTQQDEVTGLANRNHFLNLLDSILGREETAQDNAIYMVRLLNLNEINQSLGRNGADALLTLLARQLDSFSDDPNAIAGRLNGTDFVIVAPYHDNLEQTAKILSNKIITAAHQLINEKVAGKDVDVSTPIAATLLDSNLPHGQILATLDGLLALAEQRGNRGVEVAIKGMSQQRNLNDWRDALHTAMDQHGVRLGEFAVRHQNGDLLHWESPVRLFLEQQWQSAGYFVGWAKRLGVLPHIDWLVINQALSSIQQNSEHYAVNISESSLCDADFRTKVRALLQRHTGICHQLWLEFPESCAIRHLPQLKNFSTELRQLGCKVGLKHVGLEFTKIRELEGIGLDYLKVDSAIIRDCHNNPTNHVFIQSLCGIGHSLGTIMIAEGVVSGKEQETLNKLNIDAFTGPCIR
ncbi:bifunctional diguanylate cyclase/phosphodiesterase [Gilvimarinus chinensis]|uniref:bifunctional diguanylate cyclase/phosphodiesterase n=1 Tax=Gilvimarinus chinensis TaxID=396005 RepID=UPI00037CD575|nr:LapD/MoxY N-terminal periplasmic domain-containing protein [Gilvimarinus chinensis]